MLRTTRSHFYFLVVTLCFILTAGSPSPRAVEMTSTLLINGSHIDITVEAGKLNLPQSDVIAWVQMAAESVAGYYGRYPVPRLTLRITPFSGHGVRHGMTFGMHGGLIKIGLGSDTTHAELMNDWMMTHEMIHLAFPSVADEHHWIEEGISTYVEPIARIRASHMKEEQMWADLVRDMPKGQPQSGDEGLDRTHTWGRTYWGGALFCFDADVEIRRKTQNNKGLQDALRGILDAGGNITNDWDLAQAFKVGDQATGTTVLTDLYNQMKIKPVTVNLQEKWDKLGIEPDGSGVRLRDDAPESSIRRSITGGGATPRAISTHPMAILAGRKSNS
ncbi:MAG: hypothetical protein M3P45_10630 [Acidobacteriota bacterium]|nr:hypothetical protein [Acidobacteriota bacterium]